MPDRAEYYRQQATEARRRAERTSSELDRARWNRIAAEWDKLAAGQPPILPEVKPDGNA